MIEPGVSRFTVSVSGGTNLPPSTDSDNVIVVSERAKSLRLVHDAPSERQEAIVRINTATVITLGTLVIICLLFLLDKSGSEIAGTLH
jgi:hypothetical protein